MRFATLVFTVVPMLAIAQSRTPATATADGITITYLANEGVMLSSGGKKVVIDGLFLKYGPEYPMPADSTQNALQAARAPFDAVDVILATHRHGDHFNPIPVAAHFLANPRATFFTSQQVIDSLRRFAPARTIPTAQLRPGTMERGKRRREVVNGVAVELLGIPHGGGWRMRDLEHLAYVVELGGRRVLHVGDASLSDEVLSPFRLDTARIDVALLPTWVITSADGRRLIERWIRPRQVVAIHVQEGREDQTAREIQTALPGAITFTRSLETRRW